VLTWSRNPLHSCNLKVHDWVHKSLPLDLTLNQFNPVRILKIHFDVILSSKLTQMVTFLTYVQEMPGSNHDQDINYNCRFSWFFPVFPGNAGIVPERRPSLLSHPFQFIIKLSYSLSYLWHH
jgi:hypothetical protein